MKTELLSQIENKLKTNLFEGLLAKPVANLDVEIEELQKLLLLVMEYRGEEALFHFTENDELCARSTKTFNDYDYRINYASDKIDEKRMKADIKNDTDLIAKINKACKSLSVSKASFENIITFLKEFAKEKRVDYFFYKHTEDYGYYKSGDIKIEEIQSMLRFLPKKVSEVVEDYSNKASFINQLFKQTSKYLISESIVDQDTVIINVGERDFYDEGGRYQVRLVDTFKVFNNLRKYEYKNKADTKGLKTYYIDVFLFTEKYFIKLSSGEKGLILRTEHLYRDIKKVNIAGDEILEIFFHGHYDPATIILDSYDESVKLQRRLTNLREINKDFQRHKRS